MNKLKRLLNEVQQELNKEMEKAYIVYPRKNLILAMKYFERLAEEYKDNPTMYTIYNTNKIILGDLIFRPENIEYFCKVELERQKEEKNNV